MDKIDKKIINLLQADASLPLQMLAEKVQLSTTPCWRRIQQLEAQGVITQRVALIDAAKVNLGVTVFVSVKAASHSKAWYEQFSSVVKAIPEVLDFYRLSGDVDYLLRIVVPDIQAFDRIYKHLVSQVELRDVSSSFAMEKLKSTTILPLDYI